MTLRVAHVLNSPGCGGVPRVAHALVRHGDPDRVAPHVFYLKRGTGADAFDGMDIPRRTASSDSKAAAMVELVTWLEANRIDILHTHSFRPNLYARMAGAVLRPSGLKVVAHYHNDYSDKWDGDAIALERRLRDVTDGFVAVSDAVARHVADRVSARAEVIDNGIDLERVTGGARAAGRARLALPDDALAIGLVGRICRQKGVDTFVEAAIALAPRFPLARFLVIGEAEDSALAERLECRLAGAGLGDRVHLVGYRQDMADVLAALDILAAPSRWEGFGLCVAEAMAAGLPVVASDVGGIPGVAGGAALLVPPDDPAALAAGLAEVARDPSRRREMALAGRQAALRFDWARSARRLHALYDRIGGRT